MTTAHAAAAAADDARIAAASAGVTIDLIETPAEIGVLRATMESVWGPEVVPPANVLRGMALGGACLLIARRNDEPIGFALGWVGWHDGLHLHSHQVGVRSDGRSSGIGMALKLAQRAQCLQHGITEMRWTFDPLIATNATFNLVHLGARVVDFLPACYGVRRDAFNTGDVTDRVEVSWRLDAPVGGFWVEPDDRTAISVPPAYHQLRVDDVGAADRYRRDVGSALTEATTTGARVVGLCRLDSGVGYVVDRGAGTGAER